MRASMPVWLFPLGLLGAVGLVSLGSVYGYLLAALWGLVVFPHAAAYLRRHLRGGPGDEDDFHEADTGYWRTDSWSAR